MPPTHVPLTRVCSVFASQGHLHWRPTHLTLTKEYLGFGKRGASTLVEYVPLEEVRTSVRG